MSKLQKDFAVADTVVDQKHLTEGAATIGDALNSEVGIYANQFGAGSSRPVIRGQDGPRVKFFKIHLKMWMSQLCLLIML